MIYEFKSIADYVKDQPPVPGVLYRIPNQPLVIGIVVDKSLSVMGEWIFVGIAPGVEIDDIDEFFDLEFPGVDDVGRFKYQSKTYPCYTVNLFSEHIKTSITNNFLRAGDEPVLPKTLLDYYFDEIDELLKYPTQFPEPVQVEDCLSGLKFGWALYYRGKYWGLISEQIGGVRAIYGWVSDPTKIELLEDREDGNSPKYTSFSIDRESDNLKRSASRGEVIRVTIKTLVLTSHSFGSMP